MPLPGPEAVFPVEGTYSYHIRRLGLLENTYFLDVAAHRSDGCPFDYHHRMHKFSVRNTGKYSGVFEPEHHWDFSVSYAVAELAQSNKLKLQKAAL